MQLSSARRSSSVETTDDDRRMTRTYHATIVEWPHTLRDGSWLHTRRPTTVEADSEPGGYFVIPRRRRRRNFIKLYNTSYWAYNFNIVHFVIVGILNKDNCVNNNTNSIRSCFLASLFSHSATIIVAVLSKLVIFCIAAYPLIRRRRYFCDNRIVKLYLEINFYLNLTLFI